MVKLIFSAQLFQNEMRLAFQQQKFLLVFFFWFVNDKSLTVYITFALFVFHCVNWLARYMTALGDLMAEWLGMADWVGMAGWLTDWLTG